MAGLRNSYVNCQTDNRRPLPWYPPEIPHGVHPDSVYFGRALAEMDARVEGGGLTVYATNDLERLPSYGHDVVVLLIGEELTRVPAYADRVRAIFTNLAVRPQLTASVVRQPSWLNLWLAVGYARMWAHHFPGQARYRWRRRRGTRMAPIWHVPIGAADQIDLPVKPLAERSHDLFFAGSVSHRATARARDRTRPKTVARQRMLRNAERLAARHPDLAVELVTTGGFLESVAADSGAYSRALMDSRIALVPRGATADTTRFWQALRYGCVTVVDAVPSHPLFYDGAPVIRLGSWDELEDTVVPLLADEPRLQVLHHRALQWWSTRGSEKAVGAYMADRLNRLGA